MQSDAEARLQPRFSVTAQAKSRLVNSGVRRSALMLGSASKSAVWCLSAFGPLDRLQGFLVVALVDDVELGVRIMDVAGVELQVS